MAAAHRLQNFNVVGVSIIVHLLVLSVVWPHQPQLSQRILDMAEVAPVIPVIIVRRQARPPDPPPPVELETPRPLPVQTVQPTAVRMTPTNIPQELLSVAPIIAPEEAPPPPEPPPPAPPAPPSTVVLRPYGAPAGDGTAAAVSKTLRGALGCANAEALGLSKAEREKCAEQLAAGAKDAPYAGQGLDADKAAALTAAAFRKKQEFEYKRAPVPVGSRSTDGTAGGMGRSMGVDRPTAAIRF